MEFGTNQLRGMMRDASEADKAVFRTNQQIANLFIDTWISMCRKLTQTHASPTAYKHHALKEPFILEYRDCHSLLDLLRLGSFDDLSAHLQVRFSHQQDLWPFEAVVRAYTDLHERSTTFIVTPPY